jgi:transposase InsO family protein
MTAEQTRSVPLKGFQRSMSQAGAPTGNGKAERFAGNFKLAVAGHTSFLHIGRLAGSKGSPLSVLGIKWLFRVPSREGGGNVVSDGRGS